MKGVHFLVVLFALVVALHTAVAGAAPPALPPGLESDSDAAPALPPGLTQEEESPPLPPGLGGEEREAFEEPEADRTWRERFPVRLHGFWETRMGIRTQDDPAQPRDATIGEMRLQLETEKAWDEAVLEFTGDLLLDGALEEADFDLRRLRLTWTPFEKLDVRVGRQVLTWGTGDLLFINDLFPKDWQSFFIGRDEEYLKKPSDAVRIGWFTDSIDIDFVYSPQFDPDQFITGERISYWNPLFQTRAGRDSQVDFNAPSDWFEDDEFALRLYRNIGRYELAFYGYSGHWKSPGGQRLIPFMQASFPKLNVYGASVRGPIGKGIVNVEAGYYDSQQDPRGDNPFINNSEFRLLIGYEQELAKEFTGGFQYYLEHIMDYGAYRNVPLARLIATRDKDRHVFTIRLTKLLMNQNLTLSLFTYYSPTDGDAYLRPKASYKATDAWLVEFGGNVFLGEADDTFFGQFEDNTNIYTSVRYSF